MKSNTKPLFETIGIAMIFRLSGNQIDSDVELGIQAA